MSDTPPNPLTQHALRLARYRLDFPYFAENQLKITSNKDKHHGIKPFGLLDFQAKLWTRMAAQVGRTGMARQIVLKARQIGSSTFAQGILFWRTVLNQHINSIVVAHDIATAESIFQMTKRFYQYMDDWVKPMVRYDQRGMLVFDNPKATDRKNVRGLNSKMVVASAKNIHSGAGGTYQCVQLSEAARYEEPEEIVSSTLQTVADAPGTFIIIESTARPEGDWFREMCDRAIAGKSPYEFTFVGWMDDPSYMLPLAPGEEIVPDEDERELIAEFTLSPEQVKWRRQKLSSMLDDVDQFRQEYPTTPDEAWITKEFAVFPISQLRVLRAALRAPHLRGHLFHGNKLLMDSAGPLCIWEEPQPGALYDIGVDVGMGIGKDASVACVLKRPTGEQVAEYVSDTVEPGELVSVLDALGRYYNHGQICVEVQGPGLYTNGRLGEIYPNMYIWRRKDKIKNQMSTFFGFETTIRSKKYIVTLAKDRLFRYVHSEMRERFPLIRSQELFRQLSVFVHSGDDKYHGAPGYNDDCVMAWMLALNASNDDFGIEMEKPSEAAPAIQYIDKARFMGEDELVQLISGHYESDAWDARGWR